MRYLVRYVGGPIGRWFRKRGWAGVTLPVPFWGAAVLMWDDGRVDLLPQEVAWRNTELRHEILGHVPQIERMGAVKYLAAILWQYLLYGHYMAPMEIEARRLAAAHHDEMERT